LKYELINNNFKIDSIKQGNTRRQKILYIYVLFIIKTYFTSLVKILDSILGISSRGRAGKSD